MAVQRRCSVKCGGDRDRYPDDGEVAPPMGTMTILVEKRSVGWRAVRPAAGHCRGSAISTLFPWPMPARGSASGAPGTWRGIIAAIIRVDRKPRSRWGGIAGDDRRHGGHRRPLPPGRGDVGGAGLPEFGAIGIEALTGFLAAFINVRISAGGGWTGWRPRGRVTAQLGAMRDHRGDRRPGVDGYPPGRVFTQNPDRGGMVAITRCI